MALEQKPRPGPHERQGCENGDAAFQLLEHTADMGIEAWAPACEGLFEQVAQGLLAVLAGRGAVSAPVVEERFTVTANDLEELLVVWLNELLYLIQNKALWPRHIEILNLQPESMQVCLAMLPLGRPPQREVKAVTYHRLLVRCCHGRWQARVYLDL